MSRHVRAKVLALYREDAVSMRKAARIKLHLSDCARCSGTDSALGVVSGLLAAAQFPAMPDALFMRVQGAIASESAERGGSAAAGVGAAGAGVAREAREPGGTAHVPGRPDLPQRTAQRRRRFRLPDMTSPLVLRGLAATAAVAVIAGAGFLLARTQTGVESETSAGSSTRSPHSLNAPAARPRPARPVPLRYHLHGKILTTTAMVSSANFTRQTLAERVHRALSTTATFGSGASAQPTQPNGAVKAAGQSLAGVDISQLEGCLSRVDAGRTVLLATIARYLGKPATIIVLHSLKSAHVLDVAVVGLSCSAANPAFILQTTIPVG